MFSIAAGVLDPRSTGGRPARWAATGRWGGSSQASYASLNLAGYVGDDDEAVAHNRAVASGWVAAAGLAVMDAVHGADVALVDRPGVVAGVDALVTRTPGLALAALGADCVPLALVGSDGATVGVAHCGWRGLAADVVGALVAAMSDQGSGVDHAVLGGAICGQCYPVPPERAREIEARCSPAVARTAVVSCADGQPGIDVSRGVIARLAEAGVPSDAVLVAAGCTAEDPGLFSYRRDRLTGRQGIVIARMAS